MAGPPQARPPGRGPGHRRRRAARRTALDILYQADITGKPPTAVAEEWRALGRSVPPYAADLVAGVERDREAIDRLLATHSEGWPVHRMAVVDRTILRIACHELRSGLPAAVAINEAVEAARELSTEASGRFINGLLGRVARDLEAGTGSGEGGPGAAGVPGGPGDRGPGPAGGRDR